MIVNSNDKINFPHKLILTNRQVKNIPKTFANNLSGNINCLSLMKNVLKPSAKSVLIPLRLTAVASAADAGIHKKTPWFSSNKTNNIK